MVYFKVSGFSWTLQGQSIFKSNKYCLPWKTYFENSWAHYIVLWLNILSLCNRITCMFPQPGLSGLSHQLLTLRLAGASTRHMILSQVKSGLPGAGLVPNLLTHSTDSSPFLRRRCKFRLLVLIDFGSLLQYLLGLNSSESWVMQL